MFIELSHPITDGMTTYPGIPGPEITDHLSREDSRGVYAAGTEFHLGRISLVGNTGTYLDTPFHRYEGGADLAAVSLDRLAGLPGHTVRAEGLPHVGVERFKALEDADLSGAAVLIHTGWDRHWGTPEYLSGHPYVTGEAARWLVERGVALVGVDTLNIDATDTGERPVHTTLLGAGVVIVEHMTGLGGLPDEGYRFHAAPPRIEGLGTFPVRAYAEVPA
ncbi:cyclase family protein [Bailinhaonella thermotolerans]|uniref:Cyclase family protein n=1 Tax=Bailinhaonella thermotolerans TaxID=1070861 RepID=A0A3A4ARR6_9ACTN|nr:cyclase family protein [Bailinhaonella thermotolerans]RJL32548.1 cyclase family protein [Bailinhaonella thermotolerans]